MSIITQIDPAVIQFLFVIILVYLTAHQHISGHTAPIKSCLVKIYNFNELNIIYCLIC